VKVLKTQDENYLRTMRTANRKVRIIHTVLVPRSSSIYFPAQKIDKLKDQLTALADLVRPLGDEDAAELEEEELEILIDAGIVLAPSRSKGKARAKDHIVFVNSPEECE
jgi:U3 small nucleolar RNA-associated protein 11